MIGDFNLPAITWNDGHGSTGDRDDDNPNNIEDKFLKCTEDNYLHQHIDFPTRFREGQSSNCLDLCLTGDPDMVTSIRRDVPLGKSDHICTQIELRVQPDSNQSTRKALNFNKGNYKVYRTKLQEHDWTLPEETPLEERWSILKDRVTKAAEKSVPMRKQGSYTKPLWMNHETLLIIKQRNKAWHKYSHTKNPAHYTVYKRLRNRATATARNARKEFERMIAKGSRDNPKAFWKYVSSRTKTRTGIGDLTDDTGNTASDPLSKAEVLSSQYQKVFTQETTPPPRNLDERTSTQIEDKPFTTDEILKVLRRLQKDKASGPDGLFPRFLMEGADTIAEPLCQIFNKSLEDGQLPEDWKIANITPIYKKGKKSDPANYRPVSLTSCPCKVMELLLRERIMKHLNDNDLLTDSQFGFRSGRSCSLQLLEIVDKWLNSMDRNIATDVAFLDFSKAFDSVPHKRLLTKLRAYGINRQTHKWLENFLQGRRQRVVVKEETSRWQPMTSGVPQGSVLGPVLFTLYINDIPDRVQSLIRLFADDTKVCRDILAATDTATLQADLDALGNWSEDWLLPFNVDKCKLMHLGKLNPKTQYTMSQKGVRCTMAEVKEEKDLGVLVDDELTFSKHIETKVSKANQVLGIIRRTFQFLDKEAFMTLYKSMVRPNLEYASPVWAPALVKHKRAIEQVQRRATKQVPSLKDKSYRARLIDLGLPTLEYRRLRADMLQTYKLQEGYEGIHYNRLMTRDTYDRTRSNSRKLAKVRTNNTRYAKSYRHRIVTPWNKITKPVVTAPNINTFKARLNTEWRNHPLKFANSFH